MVKNFGFRLMKKIKKWFDEKLIILSLTMSNVEKNALGQVSEPLNSDVGQFRRITQGQLADSLINGEVTQEVLDLKWRTYKILRETDGLTSEITGYDENGMPIVLTKKIDKNKALKKVKLNNYDSYELEMVIDNSPIALSVNDIMSSNYIEANEKPIIISGDTASLGEISGEKYFGTYRTHLPIRIFRETIPKFDIETYVKKLNIRTIDEDTKLLEFCVSKYPDPDNKRSILFLKEIEKAKTNPRVCTMLEIKKVSFITYKCLGVSDFLEFEYDITSFDKIIEFNGTYVIKFIAKTTKNGDDVFEKHKQKDLDEKYQQKLKK
jgi:hypothetical protein